MKILGPDKFSKEDINGMRETLHGSEFEGLSQLGRKDKDLIRILWEGFVGWKNIPDAEVVETYQNIYGETDNVELVICDKQINDSLNILEQGGIIAKNITAKFNDIK